jgi:hypothetical protein
VVAWAVSTSLSVALSKIGVDDSNVKSNKVTRSVAIEGWIETDGCTDGCNETDGSIDGWIETEGCIDTDGWGDGWIETDGCNETDGWIDGWIEMEGWNESDGLIDGWIEVDGWREIDGWLDGWAEPDGWIETDGWNDGWNKVVSGIESLREFSGEHFKGPRPSSANGSPGVGSNPLRQPHLYLVGKMTASGARSSQNPPRSGSSQG